MTLSNEFIASNGGFSVVYESLDWCIRRLCVAHGNTFIHLEYWFDIEAGCWVIDPPPPPPHTRTQRTSTHRSLDSVPWSLFLVQLECKLGDYVEISPVAPISKNKRFEVSEVIRKFQ